MRKTVIFSKLVNRDGFNYWLIGRTFIGSWVGSAPKGGVMFRSGMIDLFTGAYSLYCPKTDIFSK